MNQEHDYQAEEDPSSTVPQHIDWTTPAAAPVALPPARRLRKWEPNGLMPAAVLLLLVGMGCCVAAVAVVPQLFLMPALGLGGVLMLVAVCLRTGRRVWRCEACGNDVAKTSRLCPTCHRTLR